MQAAVEKTVGSVKTQFHNTVDWLLWVGLQVYVPSDAQLHAFVDQKTPDDLLKVSEKMGAKSLELFVRHEAEPEARQAIEAQLERIHAIRIRCVQRLVNTRPDVVVEVTRRRMMPAGPDGVPNPKLVEAVAALKLNPEQMESLERAWNVYLHNTETMRQETRSLINFLTSSGTNENALSLCSVGAAGLFLNRVEAVHSLEQHPSKEAQAITTMSHWIPTNLTIKQNTILMKHCMPQLPDIIQIGRIIFGEPSVNHPTPL